MKDPDKAIMCGACNAPIVGPTDPKPDSQIVCIKCDARDCYEQVWQVCLKYIKYRLKRAVGKSVTQAMREMEMPLGSTPMTDTNEPFFKWRIKD
jgi:hypothetical protein